MKKILFLTFFALVFAPLCLSAQDKSDSIKCEIQGKIISKTGVVVKIQKNLGDSIVKIGTEGELSKYFESTLFGGKTTGWLAVGNMKVTAVNKDIITFKLIKELSIITVNGQKKNNFEIGKTVKYVWKIPSTNKIKPE